MLKPILLRKFCNLQTANSVIQSLKSFSVNILNIDVQETPNPNSIKFSTGKTLLSDESEPTTFLTPQSAETCAIAVKLHEIPGIQNIFISKDFITVNKKDDHIWGDIVEEVKEVMGDYFSKNPLVEIAKSSSTPNETNTSADNADNDDEIVMTIKQLIDEKIRPTIQADGGDVIFMGFEGGVVKVKLQGACTSCPSSEITLKRGVQNMLQFYVPEVMAVMQVTDKKDDLSDKYFDDFDESLKKH